MYTCIHTHTYIAGNFWREILAGNFLRLARLRFWDLVILCYEMWCEYVGRCVQILGEIAAAPEMAYYIHTYCRVVLAAEQACIGANTHNIYTHTCIRMYVCIHTHIHLHTYCHVVLAAQQACMGANTHKHIHTYIYVYMYVYTHIYTYIHTAVSYWPQSKPAWVPTRINIYTHTYTSICMYTDIHTYIHLSTYCGVVLAEQQACMGTNMHTHLHTYIYVHMYVYTYAHIFT
jgi:hypothetical protein